MTRQINQGCRMSILQTENQRSVFIIIANPTLYCHGATGRSDFPSQFTTTQNPGRIDVSCHPEFLAVISARDQQWCRQAHLENHPGHLLLFFLGCRRQLRHLVEQVDDIHPPHNRVIAEETQNGRVLQHHPFHHPALNRSVFSIEP